MESWRVARSQPVVTALVVAITAGVIVATVLTAGRALIDQRRVVELLDQAGARTFSIFDDNGRAGIPSSAVERVAALRGVQGVVALGPIADARNHALPFGAPAPMRRVHGSFPGLSFSDGQAGVHASVDVAATKRLGMVSPSGAVDLLGGTEQLPVTGSYRGGREIGSEGMILVTDAAWTGPVRQVLVRVDDAAAVSSIAAAARLVVGAQQRDEMRVETPSQLTEARATLTAQSRSSGRNAVIATLLAGLILSGITVAAGASSRRRDFGRRRALGATRGQLVRLVVGQTALPALGGALIGGTAGAAYLGRSAGIGGVRYAAAVAVLAALSAMVGSVGPAVLAARRDPLRALRVP